MQPIKLATKSLVAFEKSIRIDQGNEYRHWLGKVIPHIHDAYRRETDGFRSHLGASQLGRECDRELWYGFRWATARNYESRMLRLFNRGHIEEARFIALLLTIGCQVIQQDAEGNQFRISWAHGHAGGSGDGVVINCPDAASGQALLGEFKTHNDKSFKKLAGDNWNEFVDALVDPTRPRQQFLGDGVRASKFDHFVQAQSYMRKMALPACLYLAVNKNDDAVYAEILTLDPQFADEAMDRGERIVYMDKPPAKLNNSPGFFKCKFCDHRPVCHLKQPPARNCRTCAFAVPTQEGWNCRNHNTLLTKEQQLAGCTAYTANKVI